jgi:hypothetical protein
MAYQWQRNRHNGGGVGNGEIGVAAYGGSAIKSVIMAKQRGSAAAALANNQA